MIRVLGHFAPSVLDSAVIASELMTWLTERGVEPREVQIGVRTPKDTAAACESTPVLMEWHRDGAGPNPIDTTITPAVKTMLVWSNGTPTGIRCETTQPGDVVLFDNVDNWHRSPPPEEGRWFVGIADPIIR